MCRVAGSTSLTDTDCYHVSISPTHGPGQVNLNRGLG